MKHLSLILLLTLFFGLSFIPVPNHPIICEFKNAFLNDLAEDHVSKDWQLLVKAKDEASNFGSNSTEVDILEVEVLLKGGQIGQALSIADELIAKNQESPIACEIAAKCSIRKGVFWEVKSYLLSTYRDGINVDLSSGGHRMKIGKRDRNGALA